MSEEFVGEVTITKDEVKLILSEYAVHALGAGDSASMFMGEIELYIDEDHDNIEFIVKVFKRNEPVAH